MKLTRIFAFMAMAGLASSAFATNGYFSHGYGMKAKGMAGASTANIDDAFGGANNPATMAFAGNRMELGLDVFSPIRTSSSTNALGGFGPVEVESDSNYFFIPEFAYNRMINNDLALGVTVYGNGGMNTNYAPFAQGFNACDIPPNTSTNLHCGNGRLGVDLMQLIVAPTAAYKIAPNHSIGVAPLLGYQMFEAEGLDLFQGFSIDPQNVTNNGSDGAFGFGVRVGYYGQLTPTVSVGAAYASKMNFSEFDDYAGLFAEQGDFDIPENWNLGVSWQATPQLRLAADYQRINFSDVNAVGNPVFANLPNGMGADNGPGFGWDDVDVWKLGIEYKHSNQWTMRAGYSYADNPISGGGFPPAADFGEVTLNMLAPAVIQHHMTLGFTYTLGSGNEVTMAYMHAFENDVSGPSFFDPTATDTIKMHQNALGIQYSWKM
jgi:long-chain fatty acid transport protein